MLEMSQLIYWLRLIPESEMNETGITHQKKIISKFWVKNSKILGEILWNSVKNWILLEVLGIFSKYQPKPTYSPKPLYQFFYNKNQN